MGGTRKILCSNGKGLQEMTALGKPAEKGPQPLANFPYFCSNMDLGLKLHSTEPALPGTLPWPPWAQVPLLRSPVGAEPQLLGEDLEELGAVPSVLLSGAHHPDGGDQQLGAGCGRAPDHHGQAALHCDVDPLPCRETQSPGREGSKAGGPGIRGGIGALGRQGTLPFWAAPPPHLAHPQGPLAPAQQRSPPGWGSAVTHIRGLAQDGGRGGAQLLPQVRGQLRGREAGLQVQERHREREDGAEPRRGRAGQGAATPAAAAGALPARGRALAIGRGRTHLPGPRASPPPAAHTTRPAPAPA